MPVKWKPAIFIALLVSNGSIAETALSGVVVDFSGTPLPGVVVMTGVDGFATGTDSLGRWMMSAPVQGTLPRARSKPLQARELLVFREGMHVCLRGWDALGSRLETTAPSRSTWPRGVLGREDGIPQDSVYLAWNGKVRSRMPTASLVAGQVIRLDTSGSIADPPWNTAIAYESMVDPRDHQVYRTVAIRSRRWMAQNLNFANEPTASVPIGIWYQRSPDSGARYGRLYTWDEAIAGMRSAGDLRGICPSGWHLPSEAEWTELARVADSASLSVGSRLKSKGGWINPEEGSDALGFRGLPSGSCASTQCGGSGTYAIWRSTSDYDLTRASVRMLSLGSELLGSPRDAAKSVSFALRCVQDPP